MGAFFNFMEEEDEENRMTASQGKELKRDQGRETARVLLFAFDFD